MKGRREVVRMSLVMVLLDVTTKIEMKPLPGWFPTHAVDPNMLMVCGEGGSGSDEESYEPEEELVWGLGR